MNSIIKKPSAWIPIALSLAVLAFMLTSIAVFGIPAREADEGTGAHLFQIWLALEAVMMAFFAIKWVQREPTQALIILVIQIIAVLAACAPVYLLKL